MKNILFSIASMMLAYTIGAQPNILFEETFSGGIPSNWEISAGYPEGAVWQWSATGRGDSARIHAVQTPALFWNNRPPIASPSAAGGVAMYNSDVYDSGGVNVGQGPFPGNHSGSLTSPAIDCSGQEIVYLKFNQYARANANDVSTRLEVSSDGGLNWADFPINRAVTENGSTLPDDIVVLDISAVAANQAAVQLRFTWQGRYYFWLIDDIQLITPPELELQLGDLFYAPSNFAQPTWQIATDTFYFAARISNLGNQPAANVILKASILRIQASGTSQVYSDSILIPELPALCKDSAISLSSPYIPMLPEGEYRLRYELSAAGQEDFNPADNVRQLPFRVSSRQFAKEDDLDFGARPLDNGDYRIANFYHISPLAADNFFVERATFSVAVNSAEGPLAGKQASILLFKVKETVSPDFSNFDIASDESLELVGVGDYIFSESDLNFSLISVPLQTLNGNPIILEPGSRYFLSSAFEGPSNVLLQAFNDDIDYFQLSTVVFRNKWFLDGFGPGLAAVLRMQVELVASPARETLREEALKVFPNPAMDMLNVEVNLQQGSPAMVILATASGQVLKVLEFNSIREEKLTIGLGGLPAGAYLLRLSTDQGVKTSPFVIAGW